MMKNVSLYWVGEIVQHVEYVPFGEVFIEERNNTWNTPYLFNAKELDEETGLYYYGARYYDARTSVWLSADPLQEKYPNVSSYAYCVQNPVRYVDPDGRKVIPTSNEAQRNILNTLTKEEAKFIKFNKDGSVNQSRINKSDSKSENFTALKELVNSTRTYKFAVTEKDAEGKSFTGEISGENYYYGLTAVPDPEEYGTKSVDDDIWVYTSSLLSEGKQAENTAHEGYGHAYFYELGKTDPSIDPWHRYTNEMYKEWDEELKTYVYGSLFVKSNKKLEDQIEVVTSQARKNYESRKND